MAFEKSSLQLESYLLKKPKSSSSELLSAESPALILSIFFSAFKSLAFYRNCCYSACVKVVGTLLKQFAFSNF